MYFSVRKLFQNAAYLITANIGQAVLAFVQGVIVTRTLGPSEYGVWGVILAFSGMTQAFLSFRTTEPLTRYLVEYKQRKDNSSLQLLLTTALLTDLATRVLAYGVILALSPGVAQSIAGGVNAIPIFGIYGATVLFGFADALWYCVARDQKKFQLLAVIPLILASVQLAGVFILWKLERLDLTGLAMLFLGISMLRFFINIVYLKTTIYRCYGIRLWGLNWREWYGRQKELYGFWYFMKITYLSSMVSTLVKNGDVLILGYYRSDAEVGWYRLAKNLVAMIQQVGGALASVLYQDLNELIVAKKMGDAKRGIIRFSKVWVPTVLVGVAFAIIVAEPVIGLVYDVAFLPAAMLFKILIIGAFASLGVFWAQPIVLALGKINCNLISIVVSSIISISGMIYLGYYYGAVGVAWGYVSMWVTVNMMLVYCFRTN
ncbi:MAG: oligosaccharide flippase family protein [Bacteroidetes bacterium]|nr:oligosaccharide flippase family protein [Bacteroidota bacterium]